MSEFKDVHTQYNILRKVILPATRVWCRVSDRKSCLSDSLKHENATAFIDCFKKMRDKTRVLKVVDACHLILTTASVDLFILLNLQNITEFSSS